MPRPNRLPIVLPHLAPPPSTERNEPADAAKPKDALDEEEHADAAKSKDAFPFDEEEPFRAGLDEWQG